MYTVTTYVDSVPNAGPDILIIVYSDTKYYSVVYGLQRFNYTTTPYSILERGAVLWHSVHPIVEVLFLDTI